MNKRNKIGQFKKRINPIGLILTLSAICTAVYWLVTKQDVVNEVKAQSLLEGCTKQGNELVCDFTTKETKLNLGKYLIMHSVPDEVTSTSTDAVTVEAKIRRIAYEEGYEDADFLVALAKCESRLSPTALNTKGNYPVGSIDVGVFQINSHWQRHITTKQALDVDFATRWTINKLKAGGKHLWSCTKLIEE